MRTYSPFNWLGEASRVRNEDGLLPFRGWPGGYPVYYIYEDGGQCCADCANALDAENLDQLALDRVNYDSYTITELAQGLYPRIDGWASPGSTEDYPTAEDGPINCDNCGALICEVDG